MIEPTVLAFLAGFCLGCIVMFAICGWWALNAMRPHGDARSDLERYVERAVKRAEGIE